jgi:hypothetical protein
MPLMIHTCAASSGVFCSLTYWMVQYTGTTSTVSVDYRKVRVIYCDALVDY